MIVIPYGALVAVILLAVTAAAASPLEDGVLAELNRARTDPHDFADSLIHFRRDFDNAGVYRGLDEPPFATVEGFVAIDEAIGFLERQASLAPLLPDLGLAAAAHDHTTVQGAAGTLGHGSGGGSFAARLAAHGIRRRAGETISYGHATPLGVVIQLIVDDGVRLRGHRGVIFDPLFHLADIACGDHAAWGTMCTIDFSAPPLP